jgi:peptidoglycan/xylan/chitin deacetylase (PgdA/CDA1 family)
MKSAMNASAVFLTALIAGGLAAGPSASAQPVERPPQFVVFSFDGCIVLERWPELADFLAGMNKDGERVHVTFFLSGTNFLAHNKRGAYAAPRQARGASNVEFGGTPADVERRVAFINALQKSGHEIGSHAVGHFDGKQWSAAEWGQEFSTFAELFDHLAANNGLAERTGFSFPASAIAGFRAPYLSRSPGLFVALRNHRFRYDASATGHANQWPEKKDGLWRFNLASLRIAGSGRHTLSMDYNFLIAQSGAAGNPRNQDLYREQMLRTYIDYFRANYSGNRAPLHIGHHFTNYQGGVYNQALKAFARMVCVLPEVRCMSYARLADFMDKLDPATLSAYQRGEFARVPAPALDTTRAFAQERP